MMEKASSIWSKDTGIDRNPADHVEIYRPDDHREAEEIKMLRWELDQKMYEIAAEESTDDGRTPPASARIPRYCALIRLLRAIPGELCIY
jgi:hypothetical protein